MNKPFSLIYDKRKVSNVFYKNSFSPLLPLTTQKNCCIWMSDITNNIELRQWFY